MDVGRWTADVGCLEAVRPGLAEECAAWVSRHCRDIAGKWVSRSCLSRSWLVLAPAEKWVSRSCRRSWPSVLAVKVGVPVCLPLVLPRSFVRVSAAAEESGCPDLAGPPIWPRAMKVGVPISGPSSGQESGCPDLAVPISPRIESGCPDLGCPSPRVLPRSFIRVPAAAEESGCPDLADLASGHESGCPDLDLHLRQRRQAGGQSNCSRNPVPPSARICRWIFRVRRWT